MSALGIFALVGEGKKGKISLPVKYYELSTLGVYLQILCVVPNLVFLAQKGSFMINYDVISPPF